MIARSPHSSNTHFYTLRLALRIHVSSSTKLLLDRSNEFELTLRGDIEVKGKGKMTTYWLNSWNSSPSGFVCNTVNCRQERDNHLCISQRSVCEMDCSTMEDGTPSERSLRSEAPPPPPPMQTTANNGTAHGPVADLAIELTGLEMVCESSRVEATKLNTVRSSA